jgi:iron complex outermembrane receptor protein
MRSVDVITQAKALVVATGVIMKKFHNNSLKALAFSASAIAFVMAGPVYAQDTGDEAPPEEEEEEQVDITTGASGETRAAGGGGAITVTGSRIVRDTYSSISPLQVLSTENQQAVGAFDPAQILQRSEAASGTQIDATFQGFVLDNGPGSQTINLRGLGADRTLVLVNGRRLAPGGVEGAPTQASINLIPASLVDRYDLLLDGASSVYGSDAVAGVVNVVLRKDFDGLELQANGNINPMGGGDDFTVSGAWGFTTDRAVFGIGAEYQFRDEVQLRDRDFLSGCNTNYEIDQNGNIQTLGVRDNAIVRNRTPGVTVSENECKIEGISGRIFQPFARFGSVYFPANGNIANIPGLDFGENTNAFGVDLDTDGDGIRDVDFQNVNTNAANLDQTFISRQELINVFTYGEYTFPGEANITPFFEAQYSRADINLPNTGVPQLFPSVPGGNPFNPCNLSQPNGVDCRSADNALQGFTNGVAPALSTGFSLPTIPIFAIQGDRNNVDITQEQYRGVLGVRGDLPFIGSTWSFEVAGQYSHSVGTSVRQGVREDRLALAIGLDPTFDYDGDGVVDNNGDGIADDYNQGVDFFAGAPGTITPCDISNLANPSLLSPDVAPGCVAVDLFNASVLGAPIGNFASAAERDYLFGTREFDTTYDQALISGFVTGDLFDLPAGPVGVVLGAEWREDSIDSRPNAVASNGLFFGFFNDSGAIGSKWIREIFGELDIPLMASQPLVEELTLNVSGRLTDEEFYGTNGTFSIKGGWRPVAPLLFKFSYGTSFRAPNLRENFLQGQSGFTNIFDPCAVPNVAFDSTAGGYQADLDQRDPQILANCVREGRDPTTVGIDNQGLNTFASPSVEITSGGTFDLEPETSRSITTGMAFEESFASGFDFAFNFNYFDIKLSDSIIEPSGQFIVNDCFAREDGTRSPFCDRIGISVGDRQLISDVFQGFLNLDQESVRGIDVNATFGYPVAIGGQDFDLTLNFIANHLIERSTLFTDDQGNVDEEDFAGEFGFPSWTGRATFNVGWEDFLFTWQTRYIGEVEQDPVGIDEFSDAFGNGPDGNPTGFFSDTCLGGGSRTAGVPNGIVPGDGLFCRDVGFAEEWFEHTASVRWDNGDYRIIAGVTNIFDNAPPLIDTAQVFGISNTPIGNGYNLDGREIFVQLLARF